MYRVLVIGDAHVDEHQDLRRFRALGLKIVAERPTHIVIIGDFLSFNCLSEWDRNKRAKMENLRYQLEIEAGNKALDLMLGPLRELQAQQKKQKKAQYEPVLVYVEGNHEDRLTRYIDHDPTFQGWVGLVKDLKLNERGFHFVPWKGVYELAGISFTHIPIGGNGKPIGNPAVCRKALSLFAGSVVFGHTHTLDHSAEHRHGSPHLNQALSVGCFFEHVDDYAKGSKTDYWRGVVDLTIYHHNRFDYRTTSMSRLLKEYETPRTEAACK